MHSLQNDGAVQITELFSADVVATHKNILSVTQLPGRKETTDKIIHKSVIFF